MLTILVKLTYNIQEKQIINTKMLWTCNKQHIDIF
jgi:hypothetical protein